MRYLENLETHPVKSTCLRRTELCQTIAGNTCDLLTITAPRKDGPINIDDRPLIILSARVHPGESNASWMMKVSSYS